MTPSEVCGEGIAALEARLEAAERALLKALEIIEREWGEMGRCPACGRYVDWHRAGCIVPSIIERYA